MYCTTNVGIYKITNIKNGKIYIGQSVKISSRKSSHFHSLKKQNHHNPLFQKAYNKHGRNAFVFETLEECDLADLDDKECFWISFFDSNNRNLGYNLESGGNFQKRHHPETLEKMRVTSRGTNSILTEDDVSEIKIALHLGIAQRELSEIFGVGIDTINKIAKGVNWYWLLPQFNNSHFQKQKTFKEQKMKRILELFEKGFNVPAILKATPYTEDEIRNIVNGMTTVKIQERYNSITSDYNDGVSRHVIAEKYNITLAYVNRILPGTSIKEFETRNLKIKELKEQGMLNKDIADILGIHRTTVTEVLKGRTKATKRTPTKYTEELELKILSLIKDGVSQRKAANMLDISRELVKKAILNIEQLKSAN